jgi:hypothetical protein
VELSVKKILLRLELGEAQSFENMMVFPLKAEMDGSPAYWTLKEALGKGVLTITEVSEHGSVPELLVTNKGDHSVLLLDGEELAGAKQNRILNVSILVKPNSVTNVPVSCTEQGRWAYSSSEFHESGNVLAPRVRVQNIRSVAASSEFDRRYRSNQSAVWDSIRSLSEEARVASRTGAAADIYAAKMKDLDSYLAAFRVVPEQKGLLVFIEGKTAGLDFVSRSEAFEVLFPKLVKSYAMEAVLAGLKKTEGRSPGDGPGEKVGAGSQGGTRQKTRVPAEPEAGGAKAFLEAVAACDEKRSKAVSQGWNHRFSGKGVIGSALVVERRPIHMAFFSVTESETAGPMAGLKRRKSFRID